MSRRLSIMWGYLIEIVLAAVCYAILLRLVTPVALAQFFLGTWVAWSTICGLLFAAAFTMFSLLFHMLTTDFGGYLASRGVDGPFKNAYGYGIGVTSISACLFIVAGTVLKPWIAHVAGVALLLSMINLITMIRNATALARMHNLFVKIQRRSKQDGKE